MTLGDLLTPEHILVPMDGRPAVLGDVIPPLVDAVAGGHDERRKAIRRALDRAKAAELLRVHDDLLLLLVEADATDGIGAALGIARRPFEVEWHGDGAADARGLLLAVTPDRVATLRVQLFPPLTRVLQDGTAADRLLGAASPEEVRGIDPLMSIPIRERLRVEHALVPLTFRVYPDTPLPEVVDLMARRRLRAVPVVGEGHEVLGIITSGEALRHLLLDRTPREREDGERTEGERPLTAGQVMSRSVMCVAEDEDLFDAANLMVNKDVAQLPVVREGEIIGFLNRDEVLRVLVGA